jgi:hypothetical protein
MIEGEVIQSFQNPAGDWKLGEDQHASGYPQTFALRDTPSKVINTGHFLMTVSGLASREEQHKEVPYNPD